MTPLTLKQRRKKTKRTHVLVGHVKRNVLYISVSRRWLSKIVVSSVDGFNFGSKMSRTSFPVPSVICLRVHQAILTTSFASTSLSIKPSIFQFQDPVPSGSKP